VKGDLAISSNETSGSNIVFRDVGAGVDVYEYSFRHMLDEELVSFGQLYAIAAIARIFLMN